jgi:hypothetical protein
MKTAEVSIGIEDGYIRTERGTYGTVKYLGICDSCQAKHRRANPNPSEDEFLRLFRVRDEIRAEHPQWSLEAVCSEAVRILNDPWKEPNPAFRHYLIAVAAEQVA